ncbi:DnaJ domain protein [Hokovirus HKV1]|uniref:DnaJ domain protein n=1 Tax=Hokovirus HKV1 TaxID=1977638 RepID=A0A1V0SF83_9VIRU|nr:DnaJ domain protein [Hokovirus HKV1]
MKSYYDILEIDKDASPQVIKKAYKKLAFKYHPDKNKNSEESAKKFKEISEAYQVLSDPQKKEKYDMYGEDYERYANENFHEINPEEIFANFFGNSFSMHDNFFQRSKPSRFNFNHDPFSNMNHNPFNNMNHNSFNNMNHNPFNNSFNQEEKDNITKEIQIPLKDFYNGCKKTMKITKMDYRINKQIDEYVELNILPGYKEGTKITFQEKGDIIPNKRSSDITFILKTKPDNTKYKRDNDDLYYTETINLNQALTGFKLELCHLDNRKLTINIPSLPDSNYNFILSGEGFPKRSKGKIVGKGDLYINFIVKFK